MAASVVTQPTFSSGRPRVLFEGSFQLVSAVNDYNLTPDGREFLMFRDDSPHRGLTEYKVVPNWFQELKKLEAARSAPPTCGSAVFSSHCAHSAAGGLEQLRRTSGGYAEVIPDRLAGRIIGGAAGDQFYLTCWSRPTRSMPEPTITFLRSQPQSSQVGFFH
jgi:hypothetical protein